MLIWIIAMALTAAVVAAIVRPLLNSGHDSSVNAEDVGSDAAVYRDQLAALEREVETGLIAPSEAAGARAEIARRLFKAVDASDHKTAPASNAVDQQDPVGGDGATQPRSNGSRRPAYGLACGIGLVALATYAYLGSPNVPDAPHAARASASIAGQNIETLIARVEQRLRVAPDDGQGWNVLAPVYMRLSRFDDAVVAYREAIRLLGNTPERRVGLAEALIFQNNGIVPDAAEAMLSTLAQTEPSRPEPKFWLAVRDEQDGRLAEAKAGYQALLVGAPPDASWRGAVQERLAGVNRTLGIADDAEDGTNGSGDGNHPSGPSAEAVAAAAEMSSAERAEMIVGMVDQLGARLEAEGGGIADWMRLVQARHVLGDSPGVQQALAQARFANANNPEALDQLNALATRLASAQSDPGAAPRGTEVDQ